MFQMGDTVVPRYTAPKISAISYLFGTFSLLIMGDTERPRYTGFRGLSVRGITALQCIRILAKAVLKIVCSQGCSNTKCLCLKKGNKPTKNFRNRFKS